MNSTAISICTEEIRCGDKIFSNCVFLFVFLWNWTYEQVCHFFPIKNSITVYKVKFTFNKINSFNSSYRKLCCYSPAWLDVMVNLVNLRWVQATAPYPGMSHLQSRTGTLSRPTQRIKDMSGRFFLWVYRLKIVDNNVGSIFKTINILDKRDSYLFHHQYYKSKDRWFVNNKLSKTKDYIV